MRTLLRQPLLHFFVLGVALLALYHRVQPPAADPHDVVLSPELVAGLRQDHQRRVGVPPTTAEEQSLVQRYVDDEILQREATALGLGRGDVIIRRRLIQKMEFVLETSEPPGEPSDDALQAIIQAHPERYQVPARTSLQHVFVSNDHHPSDGREQAQELGRQIDAGVDAHTLGEPFLHGLDLAMRSDTELTNLFGDGFVAALRHLPMNVWSPPIASRFGWHLVRVYDRGAAVTPAIDTIRTRLVEDWRADQREQSRDAGLAELRLRYRTVRVP